MGNQHQVSWLISAHGGRKTAQGHFTQRTYGPFGEEVMADTQDKCPDCREFTTTLAKQYPVPTEMVWGATGLLGMGMIFGILFVLASSASWLSGDTNFGNMISMSLGALLGIGSPLVAGVLYWFGYRPNNVIGYDTYAFLTVEGECHHHLKDPNPPANHQSICLKGRVGGRTRETKLVYGIPGLAGSHTHYVINTWDGKTVKLDSYTGGRLEVNYRTALAILAAGCWLEEFTDKHRELVKDLQKSREEAQSSLETAYTELYIIHAVTDYEDPLELGQSPYGKFIHEHVGKMLPAEYSPKFRGYFADAHHEAQVAMQKLIREGSAPLISAAKPPATGARRNLDE